MVVKAPQPVEARQLGEVMTRDQFVAEQKHALIGLVVDAMLTRRSGAELSLFLQSVTARAEEILGRVYDAAQPKPLPVKPEATKPQNGVQHGPVPAQRR